MSKRKLENYDYNNQVKPKRTKTKHSLYKIKIIVDDPGFHEYSIDELGNLSNELEEIIQKLQKHKGHIDSILRMYL